MKLRVVPSALSLILSGGIPGLIAVTPAPAAAAKSAYTMTDLGNLGGGVSLGFGINASGEVVGRSYLDKVFFFKCRKHTCRFTQNDPFSWTAGTMTDLGTFSATAMSEATAVNRGGDVVGSSGGQALLVHNGTMTDLGLGEATGINNNHQIAEASDTASGYSHAVMWSKGTITDLGTLGSTQSAAYAINDNGQVTGWAHTASEATHVFMWSNGTITDLGTFGLDPVGEAINNHGVIVGQSSLGAWIWSGGVFQNLNNLIPPA